MTLRVVSGLLAGLLALGGCASSGSVSAGSAPDRAARAPSGPSGAMVVAEANLESECRQTANDSVDPGAWARTAGGGIVGILYGALLGAADGASQFGTSWGGRSGRHAWIGAAAGAGVGLLAGLVTGVKKAHDVQETYSAAYQTCLLSARSFDAALARADEGLSLDLIQPHR